MTKIQLKTLATKIHGLAVKSANGKKFDSGFNHYSSPRAKGFYFRLDRLPLHCGNTSGFLDIHLSSQSSDKQLDYVA